MSIGPVMIDLEGQTISNKEKDLLNNPLVGGVILFAKNYQNPKQIQELCFKIRNCRKEPLLIAVDQEGGRVQRFQQGFLKLPALASIGKCYDKDPDSGLELAELLGWLMASEVLSVGVDLSFAPVLDLNLGICDVIGNRSFHQDPDIVSNLGLAYINGMHRAGMAATGKHFPGHGSVAEDSHVAIPKDPRNLPQLNDLDLIPFSKLFLSLDAMMPAHIIFPEVDDVPVGFSSIWLNEVLRKELLFDGVIISDALSMEGAKVVGTPAQGAKKALVAGCDLVLACQIPSEVDSILDALKDYENQRSQQRLLKLCGVFDLTHEELIHSSEWKIALARVKEFDCLT